MLETLTVKNNDLINNKQNSTHEAVHRVKVGRESNAKISFHSRESVGTA